MLAELITPSKATARSPRRLILAACAVAVLAAAGLGAWMLFPRHVEVSFVTEPFEATIYLDDAELLDPQGVPYTTPCTVDNLPARNCHVAFQCPGRPVGRRRVQLRPDAADRRPAAQVAVRHGATTCTPHAPREVIVLASERKAFYCSRRANQLLGFTRSVKSTFCGFPH